MAEALIKGLLAAGLVKPEQIWGSDPRPSRCQQLKQQYGINMTTHNIDVVRRASMIMLSVKPQVLLPVMDEVAAHLKPRCLCISIAAGVPLQVLESHLPKGTRVVRVMPNTPALVGAGATAIAAGSTATEDDIKLAQQIFGAVGFTVVLDEDQLDAVTGLSGSGPAYMFLVIEALSDAGVKGGTVALQRAGPGGSHRARIGQAAARNRSAPRASQRHGHLAGGNRDCRATHPRSRWPTHHPNQRSRSSHPSQPRAGRAGHCQRRKTPSGESGQVNGPSISRYLTRNHR